MISNVQDEYTFLYISNNPLGELQNNVLAPLKRLSSLTIISSRHKLKYIQSYAFNASNLKSLTLADANFVDCSKYIKKCIRPVHWISFNFRNCIYIGLDILLVYITTVWFGYISCLYNDSWVGL
jgi:hypothetical protein